MVDLLLCYEIETHDLPALFTAEALPPKYKLKMPVTQSQSKLHLSSFFNFQMAINIQNNLVFVMMQILGIL